jgi:DNA polymerase-3 subunit alpha
MGFADYFLIVADFIGFAKQNGVSVGPGRGSAAGSIVAYCLGSPTSIRCATTSCSSGSSTPPARSMPDIDIDFAVEGRERVINYVAEKYGRDRVAQIITFSTHGCRAPPIRDAARVLGYPTPPSTGFAKLIPEGDGQTKSFEE